MGNNKVIPVRMSDTFYNLISDYAEFKGMSKSEALREILKEGLLRKSYIGLLVKWQETIENRDPLTEMNECDKCRSKKDLKLRHIDGNVRNLNTENLAILCDVCVKKLQNFMQKYSPKEKFAAWFFFES